MRVRLVSFGALKDAFGESRELPEGESVGGLLELLRGESVVPEQVLHSAAVAVNHEYARHSATGQRRQRSREGQQRDDGCAGARGD